MSNYFEKLSEVDCSKHVEKKGKFTYLSWPFAVSELKKKHPKATWEVKKDINGSPYTQTNSGCFVEVEVDVDGVKLSQIHPVLDNRNQTIKEPNAFQVNTSIQRCLVKAIALHGLGLYIYAGEDLPIESADYTEEQKAQYDELLENESALELLIFTKQHDPSIIDSLYNSFEQGKITKGKKKHDTLIAKGNDKVIEISQTIKEQAANHDPALRETVDELGAIEKKLVAVHLDQFEIDAIKKLKAQN